VGEELKVLPLGHVIFGREEQPLDKPDFVGVDAPFRLPLADQLV